MQIKLYNSGNALPSSPSLRYTIVNTASTVAIITWRSLLCYFHNSRNEIVTL